MVYQRPALLVVDKTPGRRKREGQRWNKRKTVAVFHPIENKIVGNHHHQNHDQANGGAEGEKKNGGVQGQIRAMYKNGVLKLHSQHHPTESS